MEFIGYFHPKLIHFPIAFFAVYTLLEVIGVWFKKEFFQKAAHLFLFFGVLGAVAALVTGKQAFENFDYWNKASSSLMESHELYATITLWYYTALLIGRTYITFKKRYHGFLKYVFMVLAVVGFYFVFQTGEYGGKMVYEYGIGTEYKIKQMEDF